MMCSVRASHVAHGLHPCAVVCIGRSMVARGNQYSRGCSEFRNKYSLSLVFLQNNLTMEFQSTVCLLQVRMEGCRVCHGTKTVPMNPQRRRDTFFLFSPRCGQRRRRSRCFPPIEPPTIVLHLCPLNLPIYPYIATM